MGHERFAQMSRSGFWCRMAIAGQKTKGQGFATMAFVTATDAEIGN